MIWGFPGRPCENFEILGSETRIAVPLERGRGFGGRPTIGNKISDFSEANQLLSCQPEPPFTGVE
ncbi:hypothetical protein ACUXK4_002861 [Methylorubrum extorquens]